MCNIFGDIEAINCDNANRRLKKLSYSPTPSISNQFTKVNHPCNGILQLLKQQPLANIKYDTFVTLAYYEEKAICNCSHSSGLLQWYWGNQMIYQYLISSCFIFMSQICILIYFSQESLCSLFPYTKSWFYLLKNDMNKWRISGISGNERRLYIATSSLIGWAHTHNESWIWNKTNRYHTTAEQQKNVVNKSWHLGTFLIWMCLRRMHHNR